VKWVRHTGTLRHGYRYTEKVVKEFLIDMDKIANKVIAAPTLDDARNVIIEYLEEGSFLYCSVSQKLVNNTSHNRLKYNGGETRQGYKSKRAVRTLRYSIILPMEFDFVKGNVCSDLWNILLGTNQKHARKCRYHIYCVILKL
jgi:hypothetical protein